MKKIERTPKSHTREMVVHIKRLWRPLMRCKLTVVDPKIRSLVKHGAAIKTNGKSEHLVRSYWTDLLLGPTRTLKWRVLLGKSGAFCKNVMLHIRLNSRGILDGSKMLPIGESRGRPK